MGIPLLLETRYTNFCKSTDSILSYTYTIRVYILIFKLVIVFFFRKIS